MSGLPLLQQSLYPSSVKGQGDVRHAQRQFREVDRGKGVVADGLVLLGAGARDDVPAKHHHHAPAARVYGADHTVVTPHVAFASHEALFTRAQIVSENILKWEDGKPQNVIC